MIDRILTVTDSLDEISSGLLELLERGPDFVIVIGGLGPTPDDMTLKGVALALGRRVEPNAAALRLIKEHYVRTGRAGMPMTPARRKMARLPEGATPLPNEPGTAPGVRMEVAGEKGKKTTTTVVFCLPGVPHEMKAIYSSSVHPEILRKTGRLYTSKIVMQLEGVFESTITPDIAEALREHPSAYIKSHPKGLKKGRSNVELDMVVVAKDRDASNAECAAIAEFFAERVAAAGGKILKLTRTGMRPPSSSSSSSDTSPPGSARS
jgi:molybdopterin-biosynthesis enzyme MoeA-like protein